MPSQQSPKLDGDGGGGGGGWWVGGGGGVMNTRRSHFCWIIFGIGVRYGGGGFFSF